MDFNVVSPDAQREAITYVPGGKLGTVRIDIRHLEELLPTLQELQQHSAKLVKDYH
jgi:hypothetical protein